MKVLIACEFSGIVRNEFLEKGHDALSCDLLPSELTGPHYQGNVEDLLKENWDLIIAHPPCTRLANSGVRWLHERNLWRQLEESANFFKLLLNVKCEKIAIENPIPHKYAIELIGKKYDQIIQPWMHGHPETKAICLWLKNLPELKPTKIMSMRTPRVHFLGPSPTRWKDRSRFYPGIAKAMALQWG